MRIRDCSPVVMQVAVILDVDERMGWYEMDPTTLPVVNRAQNLHLKQPPEKLRMLMENHQFVDRNIHLEMVVVAIVMLVFQGCIRVKEPHCISHLVGAIYAQQLPITV